MHIPHFMYSLIGGWTVYCFPSLATMSRAAVSLHAVFRCGRVFPFPLGTDLRVESLGRAVTFWRTFPKAAALFYIPDSNVWRFQFPSISANICYYFFLIKDLLMGMKWYLIVVLICVSLVIGEWGWTSFHVLIGHLCIFFGEMSVQVLGLFKKNRLC